MRAVPDLPEADPQTHRDRGTVVLPTLCRAAQRSRESIAPVLVVEWPDCYCCAHGLFPGHDHIKNEFVK